MVPKNMETTARWDAQVEKALFFPSDDDILNTVRGICVSDALSLYLDVQQYLWDCDAA
jgi:hypothetical protein